VPKWGLSLWIETSMRKAEIQMFGRRAGELTEDDNGEYTFVYSSDYLHQEGAVPVSLTLPLGPEPFHARELMPFFDGLIPEGWLLDLVQETWKLNPRDRMGLLLACCHDCIGAVRVLEVA